MTFLDTGILVGAVLKVLVRMLTRPQMETITKRPTMPHATFWQCIPPAS